MLFSFHIFISHKYIIFNQLIILLNLFFISSDKFKISYFSSNLTNISNPIKNHSQNISSLSRIQVKKFSNVLKFQSLINISP